MPAPKEPTTFDGYLGSLIADSARRKGGRQFIADLIGVSVKTVNRRALGDGSYTVKELQIIADALNTTSTELVERALRDYSNGSVQDGVSKLIAEEGPAAMSEPPISLAEQRSKKKTPAEMTDEELEGVPSAANTDPEMEYDEPEHP